MRAFLNSSRIKFLALVNFMICELKPMEGPNPRGINPPSLSYLTSQNSTEESTIYVENSIKNAVKNYLGRHFFNLVTDPRVKIQFDGGVYTATFDSWVDETSILTTFVYTGNNPDRDEHVATIIFNSKIPATVKTFFEKPFAIEITITDNDPRSGFIWKKCIAHSSFWDVKTNQNVLMPRIHIQT